MTLWLFSNLQWAIFHKPRMVICVAFFAAAAAADSHLPICLPIFLPAHLPTLPLAKIVGAGAVVATLNASRATHDRREWRLTRQQTSVQAVGGNGSFTSWIFRRRHHWDGVRTKCNAEAPWLALTHALSCRVGRTWRRRRSSVSLRWTWARVVNTIQVWMGLPPGWTWGMIEMIEE